MDLYPAEAVERFALRNRDDLSTIHRDFADVVPAAFAMLEPLHPDGRIHGGVLASVVRDAYLVRLAEDAMRRGNLIGTEGQFRSVRFADSENWTCRVHMHPRSLKTGKYLPTTTLPETLLGPDANALPFELAVLWRPSTKTRALRSISLAAVAELQDRNRTVIYATAPLPPVAMESYWVPTVSEDHFEPADDFDDYLPGEEESGDEWR